MNRYTTILTALLLTSRLFATPPDGPCDSPWETIEESPYAEPISSFIADQSDTTIGDLTLRDLGKLGAQLSVIAQEEDFLRRVDIRSRVVPGSGYFMVGEVTGVIYMAGSIATGIAAIAGAYYLLPDDLKFDEIDYIHDSFGEINAAWEDESIASLAPAFGAILLGGVIHGILGEISAKNAVEEARCQIDRGDIRFSPEPFIYPDAGGRLVLGARITM